MEKIIYLVWRDAGITADEFGERLRTGLADQLWKIGAHALQLNIADAEVAPAAALRQTHAQPAIEAMLSVWVDSAIDCFRRPFDDAIAAHCASFAAYLVTESQPLRNLRHPPRINERTTGFAQIALLKRPGRLDYAGWLDIWHNHHTRIAIETQSTFEYIQNVVVRTLSENAVRFDAIVEECFPAAAMADYKVFFDAAGDEDKFQRNLKRMMGSVGRFIDPGTIDVVPTSQYRLSPAPTGNRFVNDRTGFNRRIDYSS